MPGPDLALTHFLKTKSSITLACALSALGGLLCERKQAEQGSIDGFRSRENLGDGRVEEDYGGSFRNLFVETWGQV